jgi:hypothetical protein
MKCHYHVCLCTRADCCHVIHTSNVSLTCITVARDDCADSWQRLTGVVEVASSASKSACVATVWMGMLTLACTAADAAQPYHADPAWQSMQEAPLCT